MAESTTRPHTPTTPTTPTTSTACRLQGLPNELRNRIFAFAVVQDGSIIVTRKKTAPRKHVLIPAPPAIAFTCRQFYDEVLPVFYGNNTFVVYLPGQQRVNGSIGSADMSDLAEGFGGSCQHSGPQIKSRRRHGETHQARFSALCTQCDVIRWEEFWRPGGHIKGGRFRDRGKRCPPDQVYLYGTSDCRSPASRTAAGTCDPP